MPRSMSCLVLLLLLVGCAHQPEPPTSLDSRIDQLTEGAYRPPRLPVQGWQAEWKVDDEVLEVAWLAPAKGPANGTALPVILYLPGLGDGSGAGEPWRRAWAQAGYAVLSIQFKRHGRGIYTSKDAQAGIFQGIARRAYGDADLQRRVTVLDRVLQEARRRGLAGDADFARVDWQRQAVAGFDLGSQTACALLTGQHGWSPRVAVLLSPYAPKPEVAKRISIPVLSATGLADEDPFSLVTPAQRHQQFWESVTAGDSYQMLLQHMTHSQFGGDFGMAQRAARMPEGSKPSGPPGGGAAGGSGGPGASGGPGMAGGPGGRGGERPARYGRSVENPVDPREAAALLVVSQAFLDTHLQASHEARHWLEWEANRWLSPDARLEAKNRQP